MTDHEKLLLIKQLIKNRPAMADDKCNWMRVQLIYDIDDIIDFDPSEEEPSDE